MRPTLRLLATLLVLSAALLPPPLAAADGDLDPAFDGGAFTLGWSADHARASALEPIDGGGLLVGGTVAATQGEIDAWAVIKLQADGSRDPGWGINFEEVNASDETMANTRDLYDMRRDASGRTYLAGMADAGITYDLPMLARLTSTGALDDTFDGNGIVVVSDFPEVWENVEADAGEILADGRSVFIGECDHCPDADTTSVWVARRLADGAPDPAFSGDGWVSFRFDNGDDSGASAVAVDGGGRIVVAGTDSAGVWFARLTPSGNLDGAFGGGDGIAGPFADLLSPRALALDPSTGRIASGCGNIGSPNLGAVDVFTAAGVADASFSGDGHVDLDLEEGTSIRSVAFQSDGKLLAVGTINANGSNLGGFFLARLTKSGGLDSAFDDNGVKRVEFDAAPDVRDQAHAVATMGGRLVAVGFAGAGGGQEDEMAVVRTGNAQIFSDGFERGSVAGWAGY